MSGTLNTSSGNNLSNVSAVTKTPPSAIKNAVKDPKLFPSGKTIDPVWLAQTKMEAAVNANKLLVIPYHMCLYYAHICWKFIEFYCFLHRINPTPVKWIPLFMISYNIYSNFF